MKNEMIRKKYEKPQIIIEEYEFACLATGEGTGITLSSDGDGLDDLLYGE